MGASLNNPIYEVYIINGNTKYNLTPAVTELDMNDVEKQLSQSVSITVANVKVKGKTLNSILKVRQRVFIYANDGAKKDEVFRGWIWTRYLQATTDSEEIQLKCYDNLIYLQESEDSLYFASGKKTQDVMNTICKKWGISLNYTYSSITHSKLVLRGTLSDLFMSDILDLVRDKTGKRYVITSAKDVMYVKEQGTNTKIYDIKAGNNASGTRAEQTMDGMVTKVVILGKADDNDKKPVMATVTGDTSTYGTLQKLQDKKEDTSLADAKTEAQNTVKWKGIPSWEYEVKSVDIPWIRKGDLVNVKASGLNGQFIVSGIDRNISNRSKEMVLTLRNKTDTLAKTSTKVYQEDDGSGSGSGSSTGKLMWPAGNSSLISSYFGHRASPGGIGSTYHEGIDIAVGTGTTVRAADGGTVEIAGWYGGYGILVTVNHGNGMTTYYGHNSSVLVRSGQKVSKGDAIASSGNTGNSTGPHVHFGVYVNGVAKNPLNYLS